ncbi:rab-GTPase-TBC domain-containing protein [Jimgerdemannia flammicorona]|uniref:Rab-GTPase-TBC domain-containing protein n=1 Tax=Jimgerdemannia flammicorona TaxID=994334 RepID=A0A433D973_9FUNG|nr:rab-GTPase-TBC domain-containing protein [Jimgerdemannia flammicorona]
MTDEQKILRVPNKFSEEREVSRAQKWTRMAEKIRKGGEEVYQFKYSPKFIKRVFKGIPDSWRREAWSVTRNFPLENDWGILLDLLRVSSPHERQIDLDVPRTMHGHIMFRTRYGQGQRILFNVLRAFSNYDKEVGYCQGMTNVVAMLLTYFEEESKVQITSSAYATRWYITLFAGGVVPNHTLLRIWDVFFLNGFNVLYYVAVALLKEHQDTLVKGDFENIMNTLSATMEVKNDDRFMRSVRRMHAKGEAEGLIESLRMKYREQD